MEQILDIQNPKRKIYKDKAIWAGTFIGGPLTAGYLIAENFKAFNEPNKAKSTWFLAIIGTIIIFGGIFLIPDNVKIPNQLIPLIYTAITFFLVQHFQGQKITSHINAGGHLFGWWRTIGVGVLGLAITIIPIFGIALLTDSAAKAVTDSKTYGIMKHEIAFEKTNLSEIEVDKIADGFIRTTFFDEAVTKYIYAKRVGTNLEISISCNKSVSSSPDALKPFIQLRNELQIFYPDNKIIFNLTVDNLDNVVKRIE
jgi:hypothetical protein